jgi:hypothetical protein
MGYCKPLAQPNDGQSVPLTALRSSEAASIKLSGGLISGQPGCGPLRGAHEARSNSMTITACKISLKVLRLSSRSLWRSSRHPKLGLDERMTAVDSA